MESRRSLLVRFGYGESGRTRVLTRRREGIPLQIVWHLAGRGAWMGWGTQTSPHAAVRRSLALASLLHLPWSVGLRFHRTGLLLPIFSIAEGIEIPRGLWHFSGVFASAV